jgi:hypothetical protein
MTSHFSVQQPSVLLAVARQVFMGIDDEPALREVHGQILAVRAGRRAYNSLPGEPLRCLMRQTGRAEHRPRR